MLVEVLDSLDRYRRWRSMSNMKLAEENNVTLTLVRKLSSNLLLDNDASSSFTIDLFMPTSSKSHPVYLSVITLRKLSAKHASGNESIFRETNLAANKIRWNPRLVRNNWKHA